jgi:hypothetical protein
LELGSGLQLEWILENVVNDETRPRFTIFICLSLMSATSICDALEWLRHILKRFSNGEHPVFLAYTHYDDFTRCDPREKELLGRGFCVIAAPNNGGIVFIAT